MLNKDLEVTLNLAFQQAREARHEYMTVEHLLLALIDNPAAQEALIACGANLDKLRDEVASFIQQTTPIIADMDDDKETQPTLGFQRVLQRAVFHVQHHMVMLLRRGVVVVELAQHRARDQHPARHAKVDQQRLAGLDPVAQVLRRHARREERHADHEREEGHEAEQENSVVAARRGAARLCGDQVDPESNGANEDRRIDDLLPREGDRSPRDEALQLAERHEGAGDCEGAEDRLKAERDHLDDARSARHITVVKELGDPHECDGERAEHVADGDALRQGHLQP